MSDPPKTPPVQGAVVMVDVSFREVTGLYDLHRRRRVVPEKDGPLLVYDLARFDPTIGSGRYGDNSRVTGGLPGMHQFVEIQGAGNGAMTFSRAHATTIERKWIYMFVSTDDVGTGMKLAAELYAQGGDVQLVDLTANKGKNTRAPSATKRRSFQVEVMSVGKTRRWVWFLLAPYQIAWARLQQMAASGPKLAARCQRLFDDFWTDVTDGKSMTPFPDLGDRLTSNTSLGFVMYLLDPLAEGARRARWYNHVVDSWQDEATKLATDDEYRLAKRIHALPPAYVDRVWRRLGKYLQTAETRVRPLLALASARLEDLIWWISAPRRRVDSGFHESKVLTDTWYVGADRFGPAPRRKEDREHYNAFSEMVRDYNHPDTPDATAIEVGKIVDLVHARLEVLPDGQAFLAGIMKVALDRKLPLGDGGASMLFEARRKTAATGAEIASKLIKYYAKAWVAAYRSDALPTLIEFARNRFALELRKRYSHDIGRAMASIDRRAAKRASRAGIDKLAQHYHVEPNPASVRALALSADALDHLALGFELFNLAASFQALRNEPDPWTAMGFLGSAIDAYSALSSVREKALKEVFEIGGEEVTWTVATKLSMLSSAIDVVLGARDAMKSTDPQEKAGHVMRMVGAYLSLGGTIFRATPAGVVMTVVGVALQALGAAIAGGSDHLALFIAYNRWGEPPAADGMMALHLDGRGFGYAGKLVDLRADVIAQHRALDWLMYPFEPALRITASHLPGIPSRIFLKLNPPKGLGPDARWTIRIELVSRINGLVLKRWEQLASAPVEDHVGLSGGDEIAVVQHERTTAGRLPELGRVWIRGTLELDVWGDGKSKVTRTLDKQYDLDF